MEQEASPTLGEYADRIARKVATGIVITGGLIAIAIYSRPGPPRYQAVVDGPRIVRIDTRSGTVIACEAARCMTVLRRGQRLERNPNARSFFSRRPAGEEKAPARLPGS